MTQNFLKYPVKQSNTQISAVSVQGKLIGKIDHLPEQTKFGFILDEQGNRWYFHAHFLMNGTFWEDISVGTVVAFRIGQNSQGSCAVEVEVI